MIFTQEEISLMRRICLDLDFDNLIVNLRSVGSMPADFFLLSKNQKRELVKTMDKKDYMAYINFCAFTSGVNRTTARGENDLLKERDKIIKDYHEVLKRKGYNATVDDLDAVNSLTGNNPVIIFDRGKTVDIIDVSKLQR